MDQLVTRFRKELLLVSIATDLIGELPVTLPLVDASKLEIQTEVYRFVDELGNERRNLAVHYADVVWREDFNGERLPERLEVIEYRFEDLNFVEPAAVYLSATLEFTKARQILFSRAGTDAGRLLKKITVVEVRRPPDWYRSPDNSGVAADASENLQGTGVVSDAGDGAEEPDEVEETEEEAHPLPSWPPGGAVLKRLSFSLKGLKEVRELPFLSITNELPCSLPKGCHLILEWSRRRSNFLPCIFLPILVSLQNIQRLLE